METEVIIKGLMIGFFCLSAVSAVLAIGEDRKPVTPHMAVASIVLCGLFIIGILKL